MNLYLITIFFHKSFFKCIPTNWLPEAAHCQSPASVLLRIQSLWKDTLEKPTGKLFGQFWPPKETTPTKVTFPLTIAVSGPKGMELICFYGVGLIYFTKLQLENYVEAICY
jgi:hypothetical protein